MAHVHPEVCTVCPPEKQMWKLKRTTTEATASLENLIAFPAFHVYIESSPQLIPFPTALQHLLLTCREVHLLLTGSAPLSELSPPTPTSMYSVLVSG